MMGIVDVMHQTVKVKSLPDISSESGQDGGSCGVVRLNY